MRVIFQLFHLDLLFEKCFLKKQGGVHRLLVDTIRLSVVYSFVMADKHQESLRTLPWMRLPRLEIKLSRNFLVSWANT